MTRNSILSTALALCLASLIAGTASAQSAASSRSQGTPFGFRQTTHPLTRLEPSPPPAFRPFTPPALQPPPVQFPPSGLNNHGGYIPVPQPPGFSFSAGSDQNPRYQFSNGRYWGGASVNDYGPPTYHGGFNVPNRSGGMTTFGGYHTPGTDHFGVGVRHVQPLGGPRR
jgi:hypothetical protein